MKRKVYLLITILLCVIVLSSCGNSISGTYTAYGGMQTLVLQEDGSCKFNGIRGTYQLSKGSIILDFYGTPIEYSLAQNGDNLIIDGLEYIKQK